MIMLIFMFMLIMIVLMLVFNDDVVHVQIVHVDVGVDFKGDEFDVGDSDYVDDGFV